jgi:hypothetical protein
MRCVAEIVGPWIDPDFDSGLVERCRESWSIPIDKLSNEMLATFLRQQVATDAILEESLKRLAAGFDDHSELYSGELAAAVQEASERRIKRCT